MIKRTEYFDGDDDLVPIKELTFCGVLVKDILDYIVLASSIAHSGLSPDIPSSHVDQIRDGTIFQHYNNKNYMQSIGQYSTDRSYKRKYFSEEFIETLRKAINNYQDNLSLFKFFYKKINEGGEE